MFRKRILALAAALIAVFSFSACAAGPGTPGKSAYEIAVEQGFEGTESEWLDSLQGADGTDDALQKLYDAARAEGFDGTFLEFVKQYLATEQSAANSQKAIAQALRSVARIESQFVKTVRGYNPITGQIVQQEKQYVSAGSGVIFSMSEDGRDAYIVTNYHVVYMAGSREANEIAHTIRLWFYGAELDGQGIEATYVGGSLTQDIAVLKVTDSAALASSGAAAAAVGDSSAAGPGAPVYAVGNPNGGGLAATAGVVSVDSENITMYAADETTVITLRVMRVDASINGGNSGGGLFDADGRLIGIVNAKLVDEEIENIAYAIPVDTAMLLARRIADECDGGARQKIERATVGFTAEIVDSRAVYDALGATVRIEEELAVETAGQNLRTGDVLISVAVGEGAATRLDRRYKLDLALLGAHAGDTLHFTVRRGSTTLSVDETVAATVTLA